MEEFSMTKEENIVKDLLEDHPIHDMVRFTDLNLTEKLEENPFMIVKYKELYYKELAVMEELEMKYEKLVGIRYKFYRFDDDKEWSKPEIEKYCIPSDDKIIQMKRIMARQKARVRFFEIAFKAFEQVGWRMKSFIDAMRIGI
jgi:hypothetical protein